ncbi:hypothetical protein Vretimale_9503 [Volvox reticuliferus]|uniref:Helicase C-terminal domain-containing protein n=1 Tax=Volvox reticuliferus TaxID=1737510 RepID=A0A8J4FUR0_9CHLO|nr:hypothetical protein Vretifemale_18767 [Volvox reticuliferus]GIM05049.1 hypothetical protein Vretimale_9503 [Volvox reticuliferus]
MATDAGPIGSVGVWHYYAAVGNKEAKLATLVELLHALQATCRRPLAICCSARDSLDSLVYWLLRTHSFAVTAIHSDLTDKERELALAAFKRGLELPGPAAGPRQDPSEGEPASRDVTSAGWTGSFPGPGPGPGLGFQARPEEDLVNVLALTDVCLKAFPKELLPLGISLLVEFDLPPSKEVYMRRVSALFGSGKERRSQRCVVIDMVEAGAIGAFRNLESFAASPVMEMPVRVGDMFAP